MDALLLISVALKIVAVMALSAGALYSGIRLLDRLTPGIDEWKEIRKGNVAVALLYSAVMLAIFLLVEPRIADFIYYIRADLPPLMTVGLLVATLANYVLGLIAAVILTFLALHVIDRITPDLEELDELKKGNLAVATILSAALLLVMLSVRHPLEIGFDILKGFEAYLVSLL